MSMRTLALSALETIAPSTMDAPIPCAVELLIRTLACGVCGGDIKNFKRPHIQEISATKPAPIGRLALRGSVRTWMWEHSGSHMSPVYRHQWIPVTLPAEDAPEGWPLTADENRDLIQRNMLRDLMEAMREDREPFSSGRDGRAALEMMHGAWESHRRAARIPLPMTLRAHPLETWRAETAAVTAR